LLSRLTYQIDLSDRLCSLLLHICILLGFEDPNIFCKKHCGSKCGGGYYMYKWDRHKKRIKKNCTAVYCFTAIKIVHVVGDIG
jgi:hypothetical protein